MVVEAATADAAVKRQDASRAAWDAATSSINADLSKERYRSNMTPEDRLATERKEKADALAEAGAKADAEAKQLKELNRKNNAKEIHMSENSMAGMSVSDTSAEVEQAITDAEAEGNKETAKAAAGAEAKNDAKNMAVTEEIESADGQDDAPGADDLGESSTSDVRSKLARTLKVASLVLDEETARSKRLANAEIEKQYDFENNQMQVQMEQMRESMVQMREMRKD